MIQILVIDDDRHMRTACMRALTRAGWFAIGAGTGDEGLQELQSRAGKVELILLDQLMPGMSGMETLAQIRTSIRACRLSS